MVKRYFPLMLLICLIVICFSGTHSFLSAAEVCDLIDTPTPQIVEQGGYNVNFRFYSFKGSEGDNNSGLLVGLFFGVLQYMNLGVNMDTENLIGNNSMKLRRPRLFVKFHIFGGSEYIPAIGVGYDDQGYGEYRDRRYEHREKGFFVVICRENFIPGLDVSTGINGYDFEQFRVRGFISLFSRLGESVVPMLEFDNLGGGSENRINMGIRYFITPNLNIELDGKDVADEFDRIFRIGYIGAF